MARFERRRICAGSRSQNFLPRLARMRARVSPLWPAFSSTRTEITRAKNKFTPLVTPRRLGIMFGHCGRPARYHSLTICHFCPFVDKFQKYYNTYTWESNLSNLFIQSQTISKKKKEKNAKIRTLKSKDKLSFSIDQKYSKERATFQYFIPKYIIRNSFIITIFRNEWSKLGLEIYF